MDPAGPASGAPDIDELVAKLKARADARRAAGDYPPDLERRLGDHFSRIARHRIDRRDIGEVHAALAAVESQPRLSTERISTSTQLPGGEVLHRGVAKVVARQVEGVLRQVQDHVDASTRLLRLLVEAVADGTSHEHTDLVGFVDGAYERLAHLDRGTGDPSVEVSNLRRRVEALEAAEAARRFVQRPGGTVVADELGPSPEARRQEAVMLADRLEGHGPVLHLGAGDGWLVAELRARGTDARGMEEDERLVGRAADSGLPVELGPSIAALASEQDRSLGAVVAVRHLEHLGPQAAVEVAALAADKLRPGGRFVVVGRNPESIAALAKPFEVDPVPATPVHPALAALLARDAGFSDVALGWWQELSPEERLPDVDDAASPPEARLAEVVARLRTLLEAPRGWILDATR